MRKEFFMERQNDFTQGKITGPLIKFAAPILLALFLQALYGAVDLAVVGRFGSASDVSAVSTGSQLMNTVTYAITAFAMGTTVVLGQKIGMGRKKEGGSIIGSSIFLFACIGVALSVFVPLFAGRLAGLMNAPGEAFDMTVGYIRICGGGSIVIVAYNLLGSIFRGMGDSKTPMITVAIACAFNVVGDLVFVGAIGMGAKGAATATVMAQALSVVISLLFIRKMPLPFTFEIRQVKPVKSIVGNVVRVGFPLALQDFLVSVSFLIILSIVNSMGLIASAGMGVGVKVCSFIMLVPSSFSQAMSAFVAQNYGAGKMDRAKRALKCAIGCSVVAGVVMFYVAFFHGGLLAGIFTGETDVIAQASDYLRAYGIDCLLTCFLFCFIGYFNGMGATKFVAAQSLVGAFCVRIPVALVMSRQPFANLFFIGLATPMSTVVQITLCFILFSHITKKKDVFTHSSTRKG